jgi:dTDP-4-amino-4,6-dideoxy-D-galactose acyltransferase
MLDRLNIIPLKWDSNFFGISVGLIDTRKSPRYNLQKWNEIIKKSNYDLIYIFCDDKYPIEEVTYFISGALYVDGKTTFVKNIRGYIANEKSLIEIQSVSYLNDQLYQIAVQIGEYSRFAKDKGFSPGIYENLYKTWLQKSVDRIICDEVFAWVDPEQGELGLITVASKNGCVDIGLIGVDKDARGKGIASKLLLKAEGYAAERGFKRLQVVTQKQNIPACRLYEKSGFYIVSVVNVFHLWN